MDIKLFDRKVSVFFEPENFNISKKNYQTLQKLLEVSENQGFYVEKNDQIRFGRNTEISALEKFRPNRISANFLAEISAELSVSVAH